MSDYYRKAKPFFISNPASNVDYHYGPYSSISEACQKVPKPIRKLSRTVSIIEKVDGIDTAVEYWWCSGIEDADLVRKFDKKPTISYSQDYPEGSVLKVASGEQIGFVARFTASAPGMCTISVYEGTTLIHKGQYSKGNITISLPVLADGTHNISVEGADSYNELADDRLSFKCVVGGASIETNFEQVLSNLINTESDIEVMYGATLADRDKNMRLNFSIKNSLGVVVKEYSEDVMSYSVSGRKWSIGNISVSDDYTISMSVSEIVGEGEEASSASYVRTFSLMDANDFKCSIMEISDNITTRDAIVIRYYAYAGSNTINLKIFAVIRDEDGENVYSTSPREIKGNSGGTLAIPKQYAGDYSVELWITNMDGTYAPSNPQSTFDDSRDISIEEYQSSFNYSTNGLLCNFISDGHSNSSAEDIGVWRAESDSGIPGAYFELCNLNYDTNGWKTENGVSMLKFTGDSYGILKSSNGEPYKIMEVLQSTTNKGFSVEIMFKTRCIGELDTKVISSMGNYSGASTHFYAGYKDLEIGDDLGHLNGDSNEEEWIHAVMVIDKDGSTSESLVEDYSPFRSKRIYINGSLCHVGKDGDNDRYNNCSNVLLNCIQSGESLTGFGKCEIRCIRFYERPLKASEIVTNYIASQADSETQSSIAGRNDDVLPIVSFINLKDSIHCTDPKITEILTFEELNRNNEKINQKKRCCIGSVVYKEPGKNPVTWDRCTIQTQGTSTLIFPLKNFKIRIFGSQDFEDPVYGTSNSFSGKKKVDTFSHLGWQNESVYTMKCDYMESAHLNNTPFCEYYNDSIGYYLNPGQGKTAKMASSKQSPSRRKGMFDAIKGIPCVLYFYDSMDDYNAGLGQYVGTYMFNLDKSAESLGFKAPAHVDSEGVAISDIVVPRFDDTNIDEYSESEEYGTGDVYKKTTTDESGNETQVTIYEVQEDGTEEKHGDYPDKYVSNICQSFEGAANKSNSAGCFYGYSDYKNTTYNEYVKNAYSVYLENKDSGTTELSFDEFVETYSESEESYSTKVSNAETFSTTKTYSVGDLAKYRKTVDGTLMPEHLYKKTKASSAGEWNDAEWSDRGFYDGGILLTSSQYFEGDETADPYKNEYNYFAADFESRYDYSGEEEGGEEFWGSSSTGFKRMHNFVSENVDINGNPNNTFKSNFEQYFNKEYMTIYFLNMIVFGQVDNAGKNAMWDTWDGKIWFPRPYDCDTACGLDNSGIETIETCAEFSSSMSPTTKFGNTPGVLLTEISEDNRDSITRRRREYNTSNSKLWNGFYLAFKDDIIAWYNSERASGGVYDFDRIISHFIGKTSGVIGESYYNKDMANKYFKLSDGYVNVLHGNRVQRFKSWIRERLIFCDSYFLNSSSNKIDVRLAYGTWNIRVQTYSPQYVRVMIKTDGYVTGFCSPDTEYVFNDVTLPGLMFRLNIESDDSEVSIYGADNIMVIDGLGAALTTKLDVSKASKITSLSIPNQTRLKTLELDNNTYLRTLDCSNSRELGKGTSSFLNLSMCPNLKSVDLSNTSLTGVTFAQGGDLHNINLSGNKVGMIELNSLYMLTILNIIGCTGINSISIKNCPKITSLDVTSLPVKTILLEDNSGIESIVLRNCTNIQEGGFVVTRCENIKSLNLVNSKSPCFINSLLNLTNFYNLESLDMSGADVPSVLFPKNAGVNSEEPWGSNFTHFNIKNNATINTVKFATTDADNVVNMSQLQNLDDSFSFEGCSNIVSIAGFTYTGPIYGMFKSCTKLKNLSCNITCANDSSAASLFYMCSALTEIPSTAIFNLAGCKSLSYAFYRTPTSLSSIKSRILDKWSATANVPSVDLSQMCREGLFVGAVPNNFFGNAKASYISGIFYLSKVNAIGRYSLTMNGNAKNTALYAWYAFGHSMLATIPSNFSMHESFSSLREAPGFFMHCPISNYTIPNNFFGGENDESTLTMIKEMFTSTPVSFDVSNIKALLHPLVNITNADAFFMYRTFSSDMSVESPSNIVGNVPANMFERNTRLVSVDNFFFNTNIDSLPDSGSIFSSSNISSLTSFSGMFAYCKKLKTNTANEDLFKHVPNVESIGINADKISCLGGLAGNLNVKGLFEYSGVTKIHHNAFASMTKLKDVSGAFRGVGLSDNGDFDNYNTTGDNPTNFCNAVFSIHDKLVKCTNVFEKFNGSYSFSVGDMFSASRGVNSRIVSLKSLFSECSNVQGFTEDSSGNIVLFRDMKLLSDVSRAFYNCKNINLNLAKCSTMFHGDTSLTNTSYLFYNDNAPFGDIQISGTVKCDIFNQCRSTIKDVSYMFRGVNVEAIEAGNEDVESSESSSYKLGLLAECTELTTTKGMFAYCNNLDSIPWDMFYTEQDSYGIRHKYSSLTDMSIMFYDCKLSSGYEKDSTKYFVYPNLLDNIPNVTDLSYMFYFNLNKTQSSTLLNFPNQLLAIQRYVSNISGMFYNRRYINGTINDSFCSCCTNKVASIDGAFRGLAITEASSKLFRVTDTYMNTTLKNVRGAFFACSNLSLGKIPPVWDVRYYSGINNATSSTEGYCYGVPGMTCGSPWTNYINNY